MDLSGLNVNILGGGEIANIGESKYRAIPFHFEI